MQDITTYSIAELLNAYKNGLTAEKAVEQSLLRIEETEKNVHALLHVSKEHALEKARKMDKEGFNSEKALWGVPVAVKDLFCTKGMPTTAASKMLEGFLPPYSATVVQKLEDAGAIIIGKTNMDEFAMGSSTENSAYQTTKNPHDLTKIPGGSSGGSAASVVSRQCFAALGSDTGGSIRQPSNLCGCVGLKPTYGRVSRYGVLAYASSLDQAGAMARSVKDVAAIIQVIAGYDEKDNTSIPSDVPNYLKAIDERTSLKGVKIGIVKEFMEADGIDPEVYKSCHETLKKAEDLGATTVEVSLPHLKYSISTYYVIATAEASSNLARYDGIRFGKRSTNAHNLDELYIKSRTEFLGKEVQRRIMLGNYVLSSGYYDAYYKKAAQVRQLIHKDYMAALEKCDFMLSPVSPIPAWGLHAVQHPLQMYLMDIFTISLNLAGLPGLAIPTGKTSQNLPLGVQLLGRSFDEDVLMSYGNLLASDIALT